MSADARTRFPVTTVEEQPERMVVIGDVHGDLGEHTNSLERGCCVFVYSSSRHRGLHKACCSRLPLHVIVRSKSNLLLGSLLSLYRVTAGLAFVVAAAAAVLVNMR